MGDYVLPDELVDFNPNDFDQDDDQSSGKISFRKERGFDTGGVSLAGEYPERVSQYGLDNPYEPQQFEDVMGALNVKYCPYKPPVLSKTHFVLDASKFSLPTSNHSHNELYIASVKVITFALKYIASYDFSYILDGTMPMWKGKYIQGSVSCEIDLNMYKGEVANSFIVEAIKVKGSARPFYDFYREFKALGTKSGESSAHTLFMMTPLETPKMDKKEFFNSVEPIFRMASCEYCESRLEGSKVLCDIISAGHEHVCSTEFVQRCVAHLEILVQDDFDDVSQHAVIAFNMLANLPNLNLEMVSIMVNSKALPCIFDLIQRPEGHPWDTIQVRREAAALLTKLAGHNIDASDAVKNNLCQGSGHVLSEWQKHKLPMLRFDQNLFETASLMCEKLGLN